MQLNASEVLVVSKAWEASSGYAVSMTQTALLIIAGTIATLLGTSYIRPGNRFIRVAYFLFVPAWYYLARSIYYGISVQQRYLAYLCRTPPSPIASKQSIETIGKEIAGAMNRDAASQIDCLQTALVILAIWMLIYLSWWVVSKSRDGAEAWS